MTKWIKTKDGSYTLEKEDIQETYHSKSGAWSECQSVFLQPFLDYSPLAKNKTWRVLDVGFGLGLNWLCYVNFYLHRCTPAMKDEVSESIQEQGNEISKYHMEIISIENDPKLLELSMQPSQLGDYPVYKQSFELLDTLKQKKQVQSEFISAKIFMRDAKETLRKLSQEKQKFDIVLQDPFSPKKNPECWDREYFELLAKCCKVGTVLLTYSVAGDVRQNMEHVGFFVRKIPGFGGKREQLIAEFQ